MALDSTGGRSPVDPVRDALGAVYGPVETGASAAVRPVAGLPGWSALADLDARRHRRVQAQNSELRSQVRDLGLRPQPARRVRRPDRAAADHRLRPGARPRGGMGAAQSFSRAVTVDAGSAPGSGRHHGRRRRRPGRPGRAGHPHDRDRAARRSDADSVVGAAWPSMQVGFLRPRRRRPPGSPGPRAGRQSVVPARGDTVVTWGSRPGSALRPRRAGGTDHLGLLERPRDQPARGDRAVRRLRLPRRRRDRGAPGTRSDRAVVQADGSLRERDPQCPPQRCRPQRPPQCPPRVWAWRAVLAVGGPGAAGHACSPTGLAGRGAEPGAARRGRGGAGAGPAFAVVLGFAAGAAPSTSPRRPTTWPGAGPWRWCRGLRRRAGPRRRPSRPGAVAVVRRPRSPASSGSSVYALSGVVLGDPAGVVPRRSRSSRRACSSTSSSPRSSCRLVLSHVPPPP